MAWAREAGLCGPTPQAPGQGVPWAPTLLLSLCGSLSCEDLGAACCSGTPVPPPRCDGLNSAPPGWARSSAPRVLQRVLTAGLSECCQPGRGSQCRLQESGEGCQCLWLTLAGPGVGAVATRTRDTEGSLQQRPWPSCPRASVPSLLSSFWNTFPAQALGGCSKGTLSWPPPSPACAPHVPHGGWTLAAPAAAGADCSVPAVPVGWARTAGPWLFFPCPAPAC